MKCGSRKYVDLIFKASSKWANWEPPVPIRCGDFGSIDSQTGQLDIEGNIYDDRFLCTLSSDLAQILSTHPPEEGEVEEKLLITTTGVSTKGLDVTPQVNIPGIAKASLALHLKFPEGKRAASLVLHKPRVTYIPPKTILKDLFEVEQLKDKHLVTRTITCPAYALYLSNKQGEDLSLALEVKTPLPNAPAVTAGGKLAGVWKTNIVSEFHRNGANEAGEYKFTPLFELRRRAGFFKRILRDSPVPVPEGDDLWTDAQVPWNSLDDDGEEILAEEAGSGFDFEAYDEESD